MISAAIRTVAPYAFWIKLALVGALVGLIFGTGYGLASKLVHAEWAEETARQAEAERQRVQRIRDQLDEQTDHAIAIGHEFEAKRQQLEADHARSLSKLRKALTAPLSCPPGATLGDLVLPAAAIDGLRNASGTAGVPEAEPAASEPDR